MVNIECKVRVVDSETAEPTNKVINVVIRNHWNNDSRVVMRIGDGAEVTVVGRDLIVAVENAMRTNRF